MLDPEMDRTLGVRDIHDVVKLAEPVFWPEHAFGVPEVQVLPVILAYRAVVPSL